MREAWATLPESSSQPLPATPAQSRNLAHASLKTAVYNFTEAALEEAQGPLQVVQGGADGGVGAVPGGRACPAAGRPRPGV